MYKLKATKAEETVFAIIAYNDDIQEFYEISKENIVILSKAVNLALEGALPDNLSWIDNSFGVEQPEDSIGVYAVSIRISENTVRSYILNKRRLAEFKTSLLSAING